MEKVIAERMIGIIAVLGVTFLYLVGMVYNSNF